VAKKYIHGIRAAIVLAAALGFSAPAVYATQFGIYYALWHCPESRVNLGHDPYDVTKILSGKGDWGPVGAWHWHGKPALGYYCLSKDDSVLSKHAEMLRDAGIDFVYLDITNWGVVAASDRVNEMILQPLERLLPVWSKVPGAPKVVPWFPLTANADVPDAVLARMEKYPGMRFMFKGKPLILVVDNSVFVPDSARIAALEKKYTVRKMWADITQKTSNWSFQQWCYEPSPYSHAFLASAGARECNQLYWTGYNGEAISVSSAYQGYGSPDGFISDRRYGVPKLGGRTFVQQFKTLLKYPDVPIALLSTWNEWLAIRFCYSPIQQSAAGCKTDIVPDGENNRGFVDEYNADYNKDLEPAADGYGDFYYRLMKHCIAKFKNGRQPCAVSDVRYRLPPASAELQKASSPGPSR